MAKKYRNKIFFTYDNTYIYQDEAWMYDDDEYDHRSFTIINPGEQDRIRYTVSAKEVNCEQRTRRKK